MGNLSQAHFLLSASWKSWVKIVWVQLWLLALPTLSPRAGLENVRPQIPELPHSSARNASITHLPSRSIPRLGFKQHLVPHPCPNCSMAPWASLRLSASALNQGPGCSLPFSTVIVCVPTVHI